MNLYKSKIPEPRLTRLGFVTLLVVSMLVAILLATAVNSFTRITDSALADTTRTGNPAGRHNDNAPRTAPGKNYLPLIFLNSATAGGAWLLSGNAGTVDGTDFLGTTDNVTFTIRVSNTVALRFTPTNETPNLVGGFSANSISGSVNHGSVIGGGGSPVYGTNTIQGGDNSYSTISGGVGNLISGTNVYNSFIGGGAGNVISGSFAARSTIGGGWSNTASGAYAFIGGGCCNTASNQWATIGGGPSNTASGNTATIGGGYNNTASSLYATISGGTGNTAGGIGAFIGGGGYNGSFFGGNQALGNASTIDGGISNTIPITGNYAFIGGGASNIASGQYAAVGGGQGNTASGNGAFIGGGGTNIAGNQARGNASIIGGGLNNTIPITGIYAFIGGGGSNTASGFESTVGGGGNDTASGQNATVGGGVLNAASDFGATVGGGAQNTASGQNATIPGGVYNSATMTYTLAAGYRAKANHQGAFVWADSTSADFASTGNDQFLIRATGGVGINTSTPVTALDVNGTVHASGGFNGQCLISGVFLSTPTNFCNMDVAEGFASTERTAPGDLVALVSSASGAPTVRKSTNAYDELLIGVVSQNPGLVFDNGQTFMAGDNSQLITNDKTVVALVGRVNVKVSIENGAINIGDPLTSSSTPGVAMKATQAGKIIGYAMESSSNDGTVLALVQPGDYVPPAQLDALKQNAQLQARLSAVEQTQAAPQPSLVSLNTLVIGALMFGAFVFGRRQRA